MQTFKHLCNTTRGTKLNLYIKKKHPAKPLQSEPNETLFQLNLEQNLKKNNLGYQSKLQVWLNVHILTGIHQSGAVENRTGMELLLEVSLPGDRTCIGVNYNHFQTDELQTGN